MSDTYSVHHTDTIERIVTFGSLSTQPINESLFKNIKLKK